METEHAGESRSIALYITGWNIGHMRHIAERLILGGRNKEKGGNLARQPDRVSAGSVEPEREVLYVRLR